MSPPKTDIENNVIVSDYAQMDRILKACALPGFSFACFSAVFLLFCLDRILKSACWLGQSLALQAAALVELSLLFPGTAGPSACFWPPMRLAVPALFRHW